MMRIHNSKAGGVGSLPLWQEALFLRLPLVVLLIAVGIGGGAGCSMFKKKPELSAEDSFQTGKKEFDDEDYAQAIPHFQKILEDYPFSIHAIPAELKIAECYFLDEKYAEALVHLNGFEELHPLNDQIPFVIWMKAVSHFGQFSTIDRDISSLENAQRECNELIQRFPDSPYVEQSQPMLDEIRDKLVEHEFYVARFYYQNGDLEAALSRFNKITTQYREQDMTDRAIYYAGKSYFFLEELEKANDRFQVLIDDFPESPYIPRANLFIEDMDGEPYSKVSKYFRVKERLFRYFGYE